MPQELARISRMPTFVTKSEQSRGEVHRVGVAGLPCDQEHGPLTAINVFTIIDTRRVRDAQ